MRSVLLLNNASICSGLKVLFQILTSSIVPLKNVPSEKIPICVPLKGMLVSCCMPLTNVVPEAFTICKNPVPLFVRISIVPVINCVRAMKSVSPPNS